MTAIDDIILRRTNYRLLSEHIDESKLLDPIVGYAQEPLVSLADACIPLGNVVKNIPIYVSIALRETPNIPNDELTRDESAAIRLYTMEWTEAKYSLYRLLNKALKEPNRTVLQPWHKYLKLFLTALIKIPCAHPQTIWRGVHHNVSKEYPRGIEITWWHFASCTTTLTVLENEAYLGSCGERTLFSIEVFNGRNIRYHSHFGDEDEMLILPGTQMEVLSQLQPASDLNIIHLKQKMPDQMLIEPPFEGIRDKDVLLFLCKNVSFLIIGARFYPEITNELLKSWYRQKKFYIPILATTILIIIGIILGSILGVKLSRNKRKTFVFKL